VKKMDSYYEFLRQELDNYEGKFDKFILYVPDFFKLLCALTDEKVTKEDKLLINSALAYFVIPNDVIPEDIYGPMGYVDDVYVCVLVLNKIKDKYGLEFLNKYWEQDEALDKVLEISYKKSLEILEEKSLTEAVLQSSGLN